MKYFMSISIWEKSRTALCELIADTGQKGIWIKDFVENQLTAHLQPAEKLISWLPDR